MSVPDGPSCSSVKLRLVWSSTESEARPKLCFNETLNDYDFLKWQERVRSKLGCRDDCTQMYYSHEKGGPRHDLKSDKDLKRLSRDYAVALSKRDGRAGSTLRFLVFVEPCAKLEGEGSHARIAGTQHASASLKTTREAAAHHHRSGSAKKLRTFLSTCELGSNQSEQHVGCGRSESSGVLTRLQASSMAAAKDAVAQPDVFWDSVLSRIVNTIDRHHFGSKLAAATRVSASASMA